jgi:hypothetical protein
MDYSSRIDTEFRQLYNYRCLSTAVHGDGRIAPGRLARCCNPFTGTQEDVERLVEKLETRTLIDLRDAREADTVDDRGGLLYRFATADENGDTEGAEFVFAEGRTRHVMGGGMEKFSSLGEMVAVKEKMRRDWEAHGSVYAMQQVDFSVMYRTFLDGMPTLWCRALQLCAAPENHPLAFHCSAGRDRTGVLAMLILHICGASEEEILADYELSKCLAATEGLYDTPFSFSERQVEYFNQQGFPADDSANQTMLLSIDRDDMRATMRHLAGAYGSIDGYLDTIGFGEAQRARLREVCAASYENSASAAAAAAALDTSALSTSSLELGPEQNLLAHGPAGGASAAMSSDEEMERAVISRGEESMYAEDLPGFAREWSELSRKEQRACRTLGWSEAGWQKSDSAPLSVAWASLNARQRAAAVLLGYEEADFEEEDDEEKERQGKGAGKANAGAAKL